MNIGQLQMRLGSAHERKRRNYTSDPEDDQAYAEIAMRYIQACLNEGMISDGIAYFHRLCDTQNAMALCHKASAEEIVRGFSSTAHMTGASAARLHDLLDLMESKDVTREMLETSLGLCGIAILEDDLRLFERGIAWGEIALSDNPNNNHSFVEAINKCRPLCRPRLATLLAQGVRDPDKVRALRKITHDYQMPQAKVFYVLQVLGVELTATEQSYVDNAIEWANLSSHKRLRIESRTLTVEEALSLSLLLE
jgi:hypothetical protein